tara:strand:+ start:708 stop:830 length:123 start_codon:yes stop_codon:yes gene_type:complete
MRQGLSFKNVQGCPGEASAIQSVDKILLVDEVPTTRVNKV